LEPGAVITVAGLGTGLRVWLALNTTGRDVDGAQLSTAVEHEAGSNVRVSTFR
jgi:hypothetical protein